MTKTARCVRQLTLAFAFTSSLFILLGPAFYAQTRHPTPSPKRDFTLSVNVDLVALHATVRDRGGRFVADLEQDNFSIFEDGVKQQIRIFQSEDIPVTVGLVIDHSGSMHNKIAHVLAAARAFAVASKPDDQMFVVNFNEYATLGIYGEIPFTSDVDQLEIAIRHAPIGGQTALYDAISVGLRHMRLGDREKKVLVVISDGADNVSKTSLKSVLMQAGQSSALIYTIGIFDKDDMDHNPRVLRRIASATGGAAFVPEKIEEVVAICEQIAREIRNQYAIGYFSSAQPKPGAERRLRVTATSPDRGKLVVRTRDSYITANDPPESDEAPVR